MRSRVRSAPELSVAGPTVRPGHGRGPTHPGAARRGPELVRGALAALLDLEDDIEVVAAGRAAVTRWWPRPATPARTSPCSTSRCPAWTGSTAAAALRARLPGVPGDHPDHVRPARLPAPGDGGRRRRASWSRTRRSSELADAIRGAGRASGSSTRPSPRRPWPPAPIPLTDRERDVWRAAARRRDRRRHRRPAVPVGGHGAQLPVRGDRQDRRPQPRRGRPGRRRTRLALTPALMLRGPVGQRSGSTSSASSSRCSKSCRSST